MNQKLQKSKVIFDTGCQNYVNLSWFSESIQLNNFCKLQWIIV